MGIDVSDIVHQRHQHDLYRSRKLSSSKIDIDFSSNDYLSLHDDQALQETYAQGFRLYPVGSSGSMLVSGYHATHQQLEAAFAQSLQVDACLLLNSGYVANLSLMSLVQALKRHLCLDKASHASIYDGIRLSGLDYTRYRHQCMADFQQAIKKMPPQSIIFTESVFSMSGYIADLNEMHCKAHTLNHTLFVDEAHAFGCYGKQGLGLVVAQGLTQQDVPLRVIPLGKALGGMGAVVAGQQGWIDALLQCARPMIYSTAISPAYTYGLLHAFEALKNADDKRQTLFNHIAYFRQKTQDSGLSWRDSSSPIQQLQLGCPRKSQQVSLMLEKAGIRCIPMRQPTVTKNETGLRVVLNASHKPQDIDRFFEVLSQWTI